MSNIDNDDEEAAADREKPRYRSDRRTSVQFIDKNLIRRRSSGNDKPAQSQSQRLPSINTNYESQSFDFDRSQQYSENCVCF